jgi:hypothetical protein
VKHKPWYTHTCSAAELLPPEALALIHKVLLARALSWQYLGEPPWTRFGDDSAPLWDNRICMPVPTTIVRELDIDTVALLMGMELERALRLLMLDWTSDREEAAGKDDEVRHLALSQTLWRVDCYYRDLQQRRRGAGPLKLLEAELLALPW